MNNIYPEHHFIQTGHIVRCQVCNAPTLHLVLDLGHQPLADTLPTKEALNEPEKTYPLRMMWCESCTCVQLDYCVTGSKVYHPNYPYLSGITKPLADYQKNISLSLIEKYNLDQKDLVIDVGSGDGALLSGFKREHIRILGVEPTNIAKIANANGIETVQSFFDIFSVYAAHLENLAFIFSKRLFQRTSIIKSQVSNFPSSCFLIFSFLLQRFFHFFSCFSIHHNKLGLIDLITPKNMT
jgi:hypothetical protein